EWPSSPRGHEWRVPAGPNVRCGGRDRSFGRPSLDGCVESVGEVRTEIRSRLSVGRIQWHGRLMVPFSILDLSPIVEGGDAGQSLRNSLDLARHVETLGYRRYWMAEHHNLPGIASAATAVALAHVAAGTSHIRIGAGGIMLPNHAPLMVAEQFGT